MTTPKRIKADGREIRITQTRSVVGQKQNMRDTLRSLGLKRPGNVVVRKADEVTVGMVNTAAHLVQGEEAGSWLSRTPTASCPGTARPRAP